ncbi:PREDICTED: uncharacterized protein LOC102013134 isoform X4 [Chinchilla lanigera]|uniref:uncharacterized protein LOC102013134 isoform X4 n=1 Tax=Chinchilla lanigera TaxID=34839 RepID=UPI000695F7FF|nr:PREDICTED: uncharacterized protein LOC102013134 isoform X4 [Chinchilla lanigera]
MEAPGSPENFPQRRRSPERSEAPAKPRWPAGEQPLWGRRSPGRRARRRGQPCPPRWEAERKPGEPRAAPPRLGQREPSGDSVCFTHQRNQLLEP